MRKWHDGGELCGWTITDVNQDYVAEYGLYHLHHVTYTAGGVNGTSSIGGDSGAPVYKVSNGLLAEGTLTGGYRESNGVPYMVFTGINTILGTWNACLITSNGCVS